MSLRPLAGTFSLVLVSSLLVTACGSDVTTTTGGGGGGGGSGAGGGDGGGGAGGGDGGGGAGGQGGATLEGIPECGPMQASFGGSLAGEDVAWSFPAGGVALSGGVQIEFGDFGRLYLVSEDGEEPDVAHPARALLRMPEESETPGAWYCGGEGSEMLISSELVPQVVLRSISSLGACPGEPVTGTMVACFPAADCPAAVTSTVPGATFDIPFDGYFSSGGPIGGTEVALTATLLGKGGFIAAEAISIDPDSTGPQTSDIGIGYLTIPSGQPDAGAVYCFGPGSTIEYEMNEGFVDILAANLQNVSRLGSCPGSPVEGELGFCMNMNP